MSRTSEAIPVENGSRRRGIVLILTVFILGLVCGSALTVIGVRAVMPPRPVDAERRGLGRGFERMAEELDLDEAQRKQMREVLEHSRREVDRILRESRDEMRAILDEEQREKFDSMRRRFGPGMRRRRPGPPPGRGFEPGPPPPPPPDEGTPPSSPRE